MSQNNSYLYNKIKSGEYYREALRWYNFIYIYPVAERTLFITITTICSVIIIFAFQALYYFLPITQKFPVAVGIDSMADQYTEALKLKSQADPDKAFSIYLAKEYVISRESYNYQDLQKKSTFIKSTSSKEEFEKYSALMNVSNINSPILKYRNSGIVEISIVSERIFEKLDANNLPIPQNFIAEITYDKTENTFEGIKNSREIATVEFNFSGIIFDNDKKEFLPYSFAVVSYNSAPVAEAAAK